MKLYRTLILLFLISCSYLQGPAGEETEYRDGSIPYNLRITEKEPIDNVYYTKENIFNMAWDISVFTNNFEIDTNYDSIPDYTTAFKSYLFSGISEGLYTIRVRSFYNGKYSEWSAPLRLVVDRLAPNDITDYGCEEVLPSGSKRIKIYFQKTIDNGLAGLNVAWIRIKTIDVYSTTHQADAFIKLHPFTGSIYNNIYLINDPSSGGVGKVFSSPVSIYENSSYLYLEGVVNITGNYNVDIIIADRADNTILKFTSCNISN